jgi:hypothetical protein
LIVDAIDELAIIDVMVVNPKSDAEALAKDLDAALDAIKEKVDALAAQAAAGSDEDDVGRAFADEVRSLVGDSRPSVETVRRAARLAVAEHAWTERLGTLLETRDVIDLLGVSKQRVSTLARDHRLIALPQAGRMRFPAWQFAIAEPQGREALAAAHHELVATGSVSPWTAASWFQQAHPELDARDPVSFVRESGDRDRLLEVASRDAARLAQ